MNILVASLLIGMIAAAIPPIVRAAPIVQTFMLQGIKPWACDLCMSFWSTILATLFCSVLEDFPLFAGVPAFVVTFAIVRHNSEPKGPPPEVLPLEDSGE